MTNPNDVSPPFGAPEGEGVEPTQALPAQPDPTQVLPESVWARPADSSRTGFDQAGAVSPAPAAPSAPSAFQHSSGGYSSYPAGQPYPAGQAGHPTAYSQPMNGQHAGPHQPYSQQPVYQQAYGQQAPWQAGPQQIGQYGYHQPWSGSASQGYPPNQQAGYQYAGQYQPGQYYYQPQAATDRQPKRWLVGLVAFVMAVVVGAGGFVWAANQRVWSSSSIPSQQVPEVYPSDPSEDEPAGQTTGSGVNEAQSAGVVLISAETGSGVAAGTGMVLSADGKVLTNYHVVAGSEKVAVTIADTGDTYAATVLGFDQTKDVALLQLSNASGLTTVRTDTEVPGVGTEIAAVGNARGGGKLVKAPGEVTATDQSLTVSSDSPWGNTEDLEGLIETNAGAVPGDSGGPMYDADNEVVGMTTAGSTNDHTSYAVPIATALSVVTQIESGQDAGTVRVGPAGYLGIKVADSEPGSSGRMITEVVDGSPADKAGVTAGSELTRVGDTRIRANTNLADVIRALEPGDQVTVEWTTAGGKHKSAEVTLGSSPVN